MGLVGVLDDPGSDQDDLGEACVGQVQDVVGAQGTVYGLDTEDRKASCVEGHLTLHPHVELVVGCTRPTVQDDGVLEDWRNEGNWTVPH